MMIEHKKGWTEVICGSMFAGKTEELIRRVKRLNYAKKKVLVFRPKIDNRYSNTEVVSHSNFRVQAIIIEKAQEAEAYITDDVDAVAFDEAQFFDKYLIRLSQKLAKRGIRVILAGLDTDFRGETFGIMGDLMAQAQFVDKLHAICVKCGCEASRTQRLINGEPAAYDDPIVVVGADECYEARCLHCHEVRNKPKDD